MQKGKFKEPINLLEGKGRPIVLAGASGSGKSTMLVGLTASAIVSGILAKREAFGKGSLVDTEIVVTDYALDPNTLYVSGVIDKIEPATLSDDNEFISKLLFSAAKESRLGGAYSKKLEKAYQAELFNASNDSLAHKIKGMAKKKQQSLLEILKEFPEDIIIRLYDMAKAKEKANKKKGQFARNQFLESLLRETSLNDYISNFYGEAAEYLNLDAKEFINKIKSFADIEHNSSGCLFYMGLKEDTDPSIISYLLNSESSAREFLFSKLSLIYRGADWLFKHDSISALGVGELDGKTIHALRFVDTKGLFHNNGVRVEDECERLTDILARNHTDLLLFIYGLDINVTVKNSFDALSEFFMNAKHEISVITVATKLDLFLSDNAKIGANRFSVECLNSIEKQKKVTQAFEKAKRINEDFEEKMTKNLDYNESKRKPKYVKHFTYGLACDNVEANGLMQDENCIYNDTMASLVREICSHLGSDSKIRIKNPEKLIHESPIAKKPRNVDSIYSGLVNCMYLKLYASTVRAAKSRWPLGQKHVSQVKSNCWGYVNITTDFVPFIANYGRDLLEDDFALNPDCFFRDDIDAFKSVISAEKKARLGKYFIEEMFADIKLRGFDDDPATFVRQYERFGDMINLAISDYFPESTLSPTEKTEECMRQAVKRLVRDIVDEQCIVVY